MKAVITVILTQIFFISSAFAGESNEYGVKFGVISTNFEYKNILGQTYFDDNRIGPTMGFYSQFFNYDYFNIEGGLFYLQKGGQEEIAETTVSRPDGTGDYMTHDIHFDYLQLEINFQPKLNNKNTEIYGLVGLGVNYLLKIRNAFQADDNFNNIIFSYTLGAGIEFKNILDKPVLLEILINKDMTNIYTNSDSEFKFQTLIVRAGFCL